MDVDFSSAQSPLGVTLRGQVRVAWERPERLDVVSVDPVAIEGRALAKADRMTVEATLATSVVYRCVRCLASFREALEARLQESFSRVPVDQEDEDNDVVFVDGTTVCLDPYIEQSLLLALRQHPVCRADCKGLCAICGADLNAGECGCDRRVIDPRLEVLAQFLDETDEDKNS